MSRVSRRAFLTVLGALVPTLLINKAQALPLLSKTKSQGANLGTKLGKSSDVQLGQTRIYSGKETSGDLIEVILTRTKKGLVGLDGTCTHKTCTLGLDRKQKKIVCPCHQAVFDPASGAVILGPNGGPKDSIPPLNSYTINEKAGVIYIK